jgi:flagellar biogenesis protein FliO
MTLSCRIQGRILLLFLALPSILLAQTSAESEIPPAPTMSSLIFRLFTLTFCIIGMCAGIFWFAKRFQQKQIKHGSNGRIVYVQELILNRRNRLHLIEVEGRSVIVGCDSLGLQQTLVLPDEFEMELEEEFKETPLPIPEAKLVESSNSGDYRDLLESLISSQKR